MSSDLDYTRQRLEALNDKILGKINGSKTVVKIVLDIYNTKTVVEIEDIDYEPSTIKLITDIVELTMRKYGHDEDRVAKVYAALAYQFGCKPMAIGQFNSDGGGTTTYFN